MVLVTPPAAIFVLVVVLLAVVLITLLTPSENYDQSRAHVFMTVLAGLGVVITFFFYYGVVELNQRQQNLSIIQETARLSDILAKDMMSEISQAARVVPSFAASVTPLQTVGPCRPDRTDSRATFARLSLSYKIFSAWQDVVLADEFTANEPLSYVTNFLQRANSQALYREWQRAKIDFNQVTQKFGDLLFEYALPIQDQRPEVYVETARQLIQDPRYQRIFS